MQSFTSSELKQNLGDVLAAAERGPVAITRYRKVRYVLMRSAAFERLSQAAPNGADVENVVQEGAFILLAEAVAWRNIEDK